MRKIKPVNEEIGANIREVRNQACFTQEELSEKIGITPNHLSAIERGVSGASLENLKKICVICGVSADALLFGATAQGEQQDELTERLKRVDSQYRPQINQVLLAMLDALHLKENPEE